MNANKQHLAKLLGGIIVLAILGLVLAFAAVTIMQDQRILAATLGILIIILLSCAVVFALRFGRNVGKENFDKGMRLVAEGMPLNFVLLNQTGLPVYCNEEALRMFKLNSRQEFYDRLFTDLIPEVQPDGTLSSEKAGRHIQTAFATGSDSFEWWQQTLDRKPFPIEVAVVASEFHGQGHLMVYSKDMRKEYDFKSKHKELSDRIQAVMDASPLLCAVFDDEGNVLDVNREVENMFGIPDKQIFIDNLPDFLPEFQPDGAPSFAKGVETLKRTLAEGSCRYEFVYQYKNGPAIPTEEIQRRITIDGRNLIISYSRDLREFYKNKEKDELVQQNIHTMMEQLNGNVTEQATAVTESAAAIEEMVANIQSVTTTLSKNADHVNDLQSASAVGHTSLNEVVSDIREIANQSESLLGINSVMENIASQTNLLSMNAAIEAAHAGEAGRGFAVVAGEIRKLAESSSQQSKTTSAALKKIKGAIDKITRSTESVLNKFNAIDEGIKTVTEQERGVLNAMEEQKQGSQQVLLAMGQLSDITQRVKSDAQQMVKRHEENLV
jgi:PAS domain S-box-containing protein